MEDYQKRVVLEKEELDKKIFNLDTFIYSSRFNHLSEKTKNFMKLQLETMKQYSSILQMRINDFTT